MGRQRNGFNGEDLVIKVPVGTIIKNAETDLVICDLATHGQKVLIAPGGRGGLGNLNFKTATNQAPRRATDGREGVSLELDLELKLLADLALVGYLTQENQRLSPVSLKLSQKLRIIRLQLLNQTLVSFNKVKRV